MLAMCKHPPSTPCVHLSVADRDLEDLDDDILLTEEMVALDFETLEDRTPLEDAVELPEIIQPRYQRSRYRSKTKLPGEMDSGDWGKNILPLIG